MAATHGCEVASSFGWARVIVGEVSAAAVLDFLRRVVRAGVPPGRLAPAARPDRQPQRVQRRVRRRLCPAYHPRDPHEAASRVEQRLRRAVPENDLA